MEKNNKNIIFIVILVMILFISGLVFLSSNNTNNVLVDEEEYNFLYNERIVSNDNENLSVEIDLFCGDGICDLGEKVNGDCLQDCDY